MDFAKTVAPASFVPLRIGDGNLPMICFHGYGQTPEVFRKLEGVFASYTLYCFPLPKANEQANLISSCPQFAKEYLMQLIKALDAEGVSFPVAVLGFSLGARLALAITEQIPQNIAHIVLAAPDGLARRWVFQIATRTWAGRYIFRQVVTKGYSLVQKLIAVGVQWRWISPALGRIALHPLQNSQHRYSLVETWLLSRYFQPNLWQLARNIRQSTRIRLYLAKNDTLIEPKHVAKWLTLFPQTEIVELPASHGNLLQVWARQRTIR